MVRISLTTGLLLVFFCLQAQDVVDVQLSNISVHLLEQNFQQTHDYVFGWLDNEEVSDYYLDLDPGVQYGIVAVCDEDCDDLDLKLFDASGHLIDEDVATDDVPIVEIPPGNGGQYRLQVKMHECSIEPCQVGIAIFGRM